MSEPATEIKATISPTYRLRIAAMAGICLLYTLWCFWDAFVAYPNQQRHAEAFAKAQEEGILDTEEWAKTAEENGWNAEKDPGNPRTSGDILTQFIQAAISGPFALIFGVGFVRTLGRWIAIEGDGLNTSWGQRVSFSNISSLNKQRWKSKGIAVVRYEENGKPRTIVLDDWKYTRQPTIDMVKIVESHLSFEQIVGGAPETPPETPEATPEMTPEMTPETSSQATPKASAPPSEDSKPD